MKNWKRVLAFAFTLALLLSVSMIPSYAVTAQYSTTQTFLDLLDEKEMKYTWNGVNDALDEKVTFRWAGDNNDDITALLFFDDELDDVSMRVWNLIDFAEADYPLVLKVVNDLNSRYRFVRFVCDTSDWSVSVETDVPLKSGKESAEIAYDMLIYLVLIADQGYPDLLPYAK